MTWSYVGGYVYLAVCRNNFDRLDAAVYKIKNLL